MIDIRVLCVRCGFVTVLVVAALAFGWNAMLARGQGEESVSPSAMSFEASARDTSPDCPFGGKAGDPFESDPQVDEEVSSRSIDLFEHDFTLQLLIDRQTVVAGEPFLFAECFMQNGRSRETHVKIIWHEVHRITVHRKVVRKTDTETETELFELEEAVGTEISGWSCGAVGFSHPIPLTVNFSTIKVTRPGIYLFRTEWDIVNREGQRSKVKSPPLRIRVMAKPRGCRL